MAKQKKQDRNRQQKPSAGERSQEQMERGATEGSEQTSSSPADMARKQQKRQSFGHN